MGVLCFDINMSVKSQEGELEACVENVVVESVLRIVMCVVQLLSFDV